MSLVNPTNTTVLDLCKRSLRESGYVGQGQTPNADDINDTWASLQWMLQEWQRRRWLVWVLQNFGLTSTGAQTYTIGPGGDYDTGAGSVRPARIESAFLRQLQFSPPNQIDTPLEVIVARQDYDKIPLKSLVSYPGAIFLETNWPLGTLYIYPVPQAGIYAVHVTIMSEIPQAFSNLTNVLTFPFEYYTAIMTNLAIRVRSLKNIGTFPGDQLPILARNSLNTITKGNTQIARLRLPNLTGGGGPNDYNIFSDRFGG